MHQASWVTLRNTVDKVGAVSGSFVLLIGSWKITLGDLIGGEESSDLRQPIKRLSLKEIGLADSCYLLSAPGRGQLLSINWILQIRFWLSSINHIVGYPILAR